MTYIQDGLIEAAADFNAFRTRLLDVYDVGNGDSGYGQITEFGATAIPSAVVDADVASDEWTKFLDACDDCSTHQGSSTTFPPTTDVEVGDAVTAHDGITDPDNIDASLTTIDTNRLVADAGAVSVSSNVLNSTRGTAWSNQLIHRFTVTFTTVDRARYFFNSGGQIRIRGSRSGGSATSQNSSWTSLLSSMSTVIFDHTATTASGGGSGSAIGYYDLTTGHQTIYSISASGAYAANNVTITAKSTDGPGGANGDNGRIIEFEVQYNDAHSNPFFDSVDGTITSDIDVRAASGPLTVETPAFATVVPLTSGS